MNQNPTEFYQPGASGVVSSSDIKRNYIKNSMLSGLMVSSAGYFRNATWHSIPWRVLDDEYVFIVCIDGYGYLEWNEQYQEIAPGDVLCCPPLLKHRYGSINRNPWTIRWFHSRGHEMDYWYQWLGFTENNYVIRDLKTQAIADAMYKTFNHLQQGLGLDQFIMASSNARLALQEIKIASNARHSGHGRWQQFSEFIGQHLFQHLSLQEMADAVDCSIAQLNRLCKRNSGLSPGDYFMRQRLQVAADLLLSVQLPIKDIAEDMGFEDPYYFSRIFKKIHGVSPRTYRMQQI